MPRKRMLDPGFWDDLDVARLSHTERLLLVGMVSMADDYGHLQAAPLVLRKQIFGYDDLTEEEVGQARDNVLAHCRNVRLYIVDGQEYIELARWEHYQKLNYKASPQFPSPNGSGYEEPPAADCVSPDSVLTQDSPTSRLSRLGQVHEKEGKEGNEQPCDAEAPRWAPVVHWAHRRLGRDNCVGAKGQQLAWVGRLCGIVGPPARDDPRKAVTLLEQFYEDQKRTKGWPSITPRNVNERVVKWLAERDNAPDFAAFVQT